MGKRDMLITIYMSLMSKRDMLIIIYTCLMGNM